MAYLVEDILATVDTQATMEDIQAAMDSRATTEDIVEVDRLLEDMLLATGVDTVLVEASILEVASIQEVVPMEVDTILEVVPMAASPIQVVDPMGAQHQGLQVEQPFCFLLRALQYILYHIEYGRTNDYDSVIPPNHSNVRLLQ